MGCSVLPCIRHAKKAVRQSRTSRSRREVKSPQQPHVVSFRLSPHEFEQLESYLGQIGTNRSDFIRHAVTSAVMGQMSFTDLMPMAVTGIERDVFELRKSLAQQAEVIKILAAASIGTAALLMRKEDSTQADNQRRVDNAVDLAFKNVPLIIEHCLRWNPVTAPTQIASWDYFKIGGMYFSLGMSGGQTMTFVPKP